MLEHSDSALGAAGLGVAGQQGEETNGKAGLGEQRCEQWPGHSVLAAASSVRAPRGLRGATLRPMPKCGALPEKARGGATL